MTHLILKLKRGIHGQWSKMMRPLETNVGSSERISVGRIATGLFFVIQTLFLSGCKDTGGQVIGYVNGVLNRATLSASPSSVTLNEGSSTTVTIRFNHPITKATTLDWSVNATTSEFSAVSGAITVPLDAQSVSLVLTSVDNAAADGTRAYTLSVSGSIVDFINDLSLSLSILDDESATSMTWNFATTGDYTYDTNYIDLSSGTKASLKTVNTTFNDSSTFNSGTHVGTAYSGGVLKIGDSFYSTKSLVTLISAKSSNLMGYWRMDGDWSDSSGNGNTLSVTGSPTQSSDAILSTSSNIPGSGTYFSNSSGTLQNQIFTYSVWVKLSSLSANTAVIGWSSNNGPELRINSSGIVVLQYQGTATVLSSTTALQTGVWYHIGVTNDSAKNAKIYINGNLEASTTHAVTFTLSDFQLASRNSGLEPFTGLMDEVGVWNTNLSSSEIFSIYEAQNARFGLGSSLSSSWTPKWSNLVGYWKMDGNWLDSSGNGNNGTVSGTSAFGTAKIGSSSGSFDGSTKVATTNNAPSGSDARTVMLWAYHTSFSNLALLGGGNDGSAGRNFDILLSTYDNGNGCIFLYLGSGYRINAGCGLVPLSAWNHITIVVPPGATQTSQILFYLNGVLVSSASTPSTPQTINTASTPFYIGGDNNSVYSSFIGRLDDIAVWSTALSASDIALIYNRQKQKYAGSYDSPIVDMGASGATWTSLASVNSLPFYKELPGDGSNESSSNYSAITSNFSSNLLASLQLNSSVTDSTGKTTALLGNPTYTSGALGKSLLLDGAGDGVSISPASSFDKPANGAMTWSIWINFSSTPSTNIRAIFSKRNNPVPNEGFEFSQDPTGVINFRVDDGPTSLNLTSTTVFTPGRWYHVLFEIDGSNAYVYVNGKLDKSSTNATYANLISSTSDLYIGYDGRLVTGIDDLAATIDEVNLWSRALSAAEVLELYRRGANRVKYQARSCVDSSCVCKAFSTSPAGSASDCDGDGIPNSSDTSDSYAADWIGPDGTASTYFSELQNNTSVDASGNPTGSVNTTGLTLDWSGSFFTAAARPTANRYFQYRVYMESDDENNLCSGSPCMPEVTSITVGPTGRYYGGSPTVVNNTALSFNQLQTMTRSDTGSCTTYQLSTDGGSTWKWWDGSSWAATSGGVSSSNYLSDFTTPRLQSLSSGNYKFKAFLNTNTSGDFTQSCDLNSIGVTYTP